MEGCGVGPQVCRLLTQYWDHSTILERVIRYYGDPFQGSWGVTQGDPLYPLIFNIVADAIFHHWFGLVADKEATPDSFGYMVTEKAALFNAYDGLIASTNMVWLQWGFDVLIGLFEWVRIMNNVAKTFEMVCQPWTIAGKKSPQPMGNE